MEGAKSNPVCHACANLDFLGPINRLLAEKSVHDHISQDEHVNMAGVDSASSTCPICAAIMKGWAQCRKLVVRDAIQIGEFPPSEEPPDLHLPANKIKAYRNGRVDLELFKRDKAVEDGQKNRASIFLRARCNVAGTTTSWDIHDELVAELRLVLETADESNELLDNVDQGISNNPLSQKSIGVAKKWLEACVQTHGSTCNSAGGDGSWTPTRLLEVVPGDTKIYLRESKNFSPSECARFVALSHCWGQGGTPSTTTHATLPLRMGGVEITELPRTFRDSVILVASLGLRYIWIDSLCIIQDDSDDWAREAAQMAKVYRNAHLVLNAANSDADTAGFLNPRQIPDFAKTSYEYLGLQLLPANEDSERWSSTARIVDSLIAEPVSTRAWCLQERYLPARALGYGTYQMFWECESMRASEAGVATAQDGSWLKRLCQTGNVESSVFALANREASAELEARNVNWADWYRMIENYTDRSITKSTDRLPALSGLAQAIIRETIDKSGYLAGIWKTGLLEGLLWCKSKPGDALSPTLEYVAPFWSWAAVTGRVQFPIYRFWEERARWKAKMTNFEPLAEYISHKIEAQTADQYGRLLEGRLTLRAPLLLVTKERSKKSKEPELNNTGDEPPRRSEVADSVYRFEVGDGEKVWIEGGLDDPAQKGKADQIFVLFLTRLPFLQDWGYVEHRFGLLLKPVGGNLFARIGFVDGVMMKENRAIFLKNFETLFWSRPYKDQDWSEEYDRQDVAIDHFKFEKQEVEIC
ncbi:heterokaryon incompatibility protein-domain-containing protein [Cladorrhinum sp. PSN332]|nr:heterokaryon incompatibility protein-domain-containing protein [Cladorrhinum sp. PSN332]